jgi:hypothetical protein
VFPTYHAGRLEKIHPGGIFTENQESGLRPVRRLVYRAGP